MPKPRMRLTVLFVIALLNVTILGCAQKSFAQKGYAQKDDCRSCHASGKVAADLSAIYANPKSHHPVGVKYPFGSTVSPDFKLPDVQSGGVTFFDRNGNGRPDSNEVQLYSVNGAAIVECATCHIEHGATPPPAHALPAMYLRVTNIGSALCSTCHSQ